MGKGKLKEGESVTLENWYGDDVEKTNRMHVLSAEEGLKNDGRLASVGFSQPVRLEPTKKPKRKEKGRP